MGEAPEESFKAAFGDVAVEVTDGETQSSISDLPRACFRLASRDAEEETLDYLAGVRIEIDDHELFDGAVLEADPGAEDVEIKCQGGVGLTETVMHGLVAEEIPAQDIAYGSAREAGFTDDRIVIEGLDELPREVFEVVVPVDGIELDTETRVGDVAFLPPDEVQKLLASFKEGDQMLALVEDAPAFAVAAVQEHRIYAAEQHGVQEIEQALAWLAARARYGLSHLPSGTLQRYRRATAHTIPRRRDVVAVRGVQTRRRWLRRSASDRETAALKLGSGSQILLPSLPEKVTFSERQALLSARRALTDGDPAQRVQAFWEALEFYVAETPRQRLFSASERKAVLRCLQEAVDPDQHQRVALLLDMVDKPSALELLKQTLVADRVPVTDAEIGLLAKLRKARNKATHGGEVTAASDEEIDHGCSILSRAVTYRFGQSAGL